MSESWENNHNIGILIALLLLLYSLVVLLFKLFTLV